MMSILITHFNAPMLLNTKINKLGMKRIQDSMDECEPV